jgi:hypothetical protein
MILNNSGIIGQILGFNVWSQLWKLPENTLSLLIVQNDHTPFSKQKLKVSSQEEKTLQTRKQCI